jgi:THO complex subunit 2
MNISHQNHPNQQNHQSQQNQQNSPRGGGAGRRQSRNGGRGGSSNPPSPSVSQASPMAMAPPANAFQVSKPAQAPSPAPAPSSDEPSTPSRAVPESNEYLTPMRVVKWNGQARDAVVQAAVSAMRDGDLLTLSVIFHELIESAMDLTMGAGELGAMVRDIIAAPCGDDVDPVATFLDTLSSLTQDKDRQALVKQLLVATHIDVSRMRTELESELLGTLGLVRDSFGKMAVRKATHALYRQSNYNLLREETEGYSKLMTEYFTTVNNEPPTLDVVKETYQRVNALIGAFDLDIGRVLDVTLDVFANLLVKHGRFFVKYLRSSAWWPEPRGLEGIEWEEPEVATLPHWAQPDSQQWRDSEEEQAAQVLRREQRDRKFWQGMGDRTGIQSYFEIGARRIITNNRPLDQSLPAEGATPSKQQLARQWQDEWIKVTGTLPPSGNDIAAQLLGFKLRFYASDARDASDFLPDNLIHLAALLIKIGFISILDLYPHLYPLEEDMAAHRDKLLKAKKDKEMKERGTVVNALTMSGALPDEGPHGLPAVNRLREVAPKPDSDRSTPAKSDDSADKKSALPEPMDQKYHLLKSLLCIGALPEALFILGRHPWLTEVYPDLHTFICRLGHQSIGKVYEATQLLPDEHTPTTTKGAAANRAPSRSSEFIPRRTLRWPKPDLRDAGDGIDYKFYWEDWMDNVPECQTVEDLIKLCNSLLGLLGPECGQDTTLLTKIIRIGRKSLDDDASGPNKKRWRDFSATFIAPALSFTGTNPGVVNEAWDLFKHFDTATRYTIYQQWFSSTKPASIRDTFEKVRIATNHELSRVSTKNTKEYGRKIAKLSSSSPGIVFQLTLKRLINYPNMIDTLVECVRYLTLLGYDVLNWTLVNFFLRPEKDGIQKDGMLSAAWLKNIATFVGKAYQRHSYMDPTPVLQYITHQLLQTEGELFMLDVLEQTIKHMGGISIYDSLSESLIISLCAGPTLRNHTFEHNLSDKGHLAGSSARRLLRYLKDTGLAPQILVALAQHVEAFAYRVDQQDSPDKVILHNLDKMRANLLQYIEFLRLYLPAEDFDSLFPGPVEMMAEFGVEPDIALTVARGSIAAKVNAVRAQKQITHTDKANLSGADVTMGGVDDKPTVNGVASYASTLTNGVAVTTEGGDVEMTEDVSLNRVETPSPEALNPEVMALAERLRSELPGTFGDHPCLSFYVTFWQLSLRDVDDGGLKQQYQKTIAYHQRSLAPPPPDRRGYTSTVPKRETDDMRKAKLEIAKLELEQQEVLAANTLSLGHLRIEMRRWFEGIAMMDARSDALHKALLQDCFLPRSRMSLEDAQYVAAMLKFMHRSGVPGFRTIKLLDLLFNTNKLACIISMYSVDESLIFGRFLNSLLRELQLWHQNKDDEYVKSALGANKNLPGFGRKFDDDRNPTEHLHYDDFCKLLYKWHKALFTALKSCLESGEFQQIRNSLNIITALVGCFPKVDTMASDLLSSIEQISEHDERADVNTVAKSSRASFTKGFREHTFQSEAGFRNVPEPPKPAPTNGDSKAPSDKANTPQTQDSPAARFNASAPTFNPKSEPNGIRPAPAGKVDDVTQKRPIPKSITPAPPVKEKEPAQPAPRLHESRTLTPAQTPREIPRPSSNTPIHSSNVPGVPPRPENRHTSQSNSVGRAAHALPVRPDSQPRVRQPDRPAVDRPADYVPNRGYDNRVPANDYGRPDRLGDQARQREASPGRHARPLPGGRTPDRIHPSVDHREWSGREARDYDDRGMRAPARDIRGAPVRGPPAWEPRDVGRDQRERPDSRGHSGPPTIEPRRMPSSSSLAQEHPPPRRDISQPHTHHAAERSDYGPPRLPQAAPLPPVEGPTVNPARAALINQAEHGRPELPRADRDNRRERGPRPQSPRRNDDRHAEDRRGDDRRPDERPNPIYNGRPEMPREQREDRAPPPLHQGPRDRREEPIASTPTGPRGARNEPPPATNTPRDVFQPLPAPRSVVRQVQDPNYGRLNQPAEATPPSGPRSESTAAAALPSPLIRPGERPQAQPQSTTPMPPSGPAASIPAGIHPSRMDLFPRPPAGPGLQTNMPNVPSGPRASGRAPQPPLASSPVNRGPPTGPAARGDRRNNPLGAINSVLTQNASPQERPAERTAPPQQGVQVRGRGSTRAHASQEGQGDMTSPMPPPSHATTPNSRVDGLHGRSSRADQPSSRTDGAPQDDGKNESRSHRESRRSERSGRDRSRSPDRGDRRSDERGSRNGATDRPPRAEGEDRSSRDKRGSDRDASSRRDRGEGGERSSRESRDSRRERGTRDDGGRREDRDRRNRGGAGNGSTGSDDARKRARDQQDQGQARGDEKRRK